MTERDFDGYLNHMKKVGEEMSSLRRNEALI